MSRSPLLALIVIAALSFGGCGGGGSGGGGFDSDKAEKKIAQIVEDQNPGQKVKSVTCPDDIDSTKGTKANCHVVMKDGAEGVIHITLTDDEGAFHATGGGGPPTAPR